MAKYNTRQLVADRIMLNFLSADLAAYNANTAFQQCWAKSKLTDFCCTKIVLYEEVTIGIGVAMKCLILTSAVPKEVWFRYLE